VATAGDQRPSIVARDGSERRVVPRVEPKCRSKVPSSRRRACASSTSPPRGAQVELAASLPPSGRCDLRIQFSEGEFRGPRHRSALPCAELRRRRAPTGRVVLYRAGLEFDEIDPESLAWLSSNVLFQTGT